MARGEGNTGERWKTTIGLISKKANLHVQHTFFCTFLCRCFQQLQRETSRNVFIEETSYVFSFTFFHCAYFLLALVAASIFHSVTGATNKFSCCSSNKKMSPLFFISRSRSLSHFFSLSFAGLPPTSSFLCLFLVLYSEFVDMTINLGLIF